MNIVSYSIDIEDRVESTTGQNEGKYHVKQWVTYVTVEAGEKKWKQVPYQTKIFCTLEEWAVVRDKSKKKVTVRVSDLRSMIVKIEAKVDNIIKELKIRDRKTFELFFLAEHDLQLVSGQFELKINKLKARKPEPKWSTIEKYETAYKSLIEFSHNKLTFQEIDVDFLNEYQDWYTSEQREGDEVKGRGQALTSVGINLRHARAVFNQAIKLKVVSPDLYPFGMDKYIIPEGEQEVKKFLTVDEVVKFIEWVPKDENLTYWHEVACFLYFASGMNVVDFLTLKIGQDKGNHLLKERVKTEGKKKKVRRMVIPVHEFMRSVIVRRGNKSLDPGEYIFPVFNHGMDSTDRWKERKRFITEFDRALGAISIQLELPIKVTSYVLRHSFSWALMQMGGTTEELQDSLGHGSKATAENYKHGFSLDRKKQISDGLYKKKA